MCARPRHAPSPGQGCCPWRSLTDRDPPTDRTLTLIVLQEPVGPHVPQLHRVVHAGGRNARAAGVEVHVGDEAGETGPSPHRGLCWHRPPPHLLMLSQSPPPSLQQVAKESKGAVTATT